MRNWLLFGLIVVLVSANAYAQERRAYEGVVDLKGKTIGTLILLEGEGDSVKGWIRLGKFTPVESGSLSGGKAEFRAAGNSYTIDERKGRIAYSGPDGEANRYIQRLTRVTGRFEEHTEASRFGSGDVLKVEVEGRPRDLRSGRPALWKRQGAPFENFERVEELVGKDVSFWLAEADQWTGRVVAIEEPEGMDIPLKAPKAPKGKTEKQDKK